jgi:hypothetical protein
MSDFEREQIMQNRDLRILAENSALVNYQEFLPEKLPIEVGKSKTMSKLQVKIDGERKELEKVKYLLQNVFKMGEVFSGISVSDYAIDIAIKRAKKGNFRLYKVLLEIIAERIEWWKDCDINKAKYAQEVYGNFERFIKEIENAENKG